MGDKLEKFISHNKEGFDAKGPSGDLWNRIEADLPQEQEASWWSYWKVAAMLFLVTTVVLLVDRFQQVESQVEETTSLSAEFSEAEQFYSRLISERKIQIDAYGIHGNLHREFLDDMNELDDLYLELRSTFENKNGDQKLIDAMISNLRLRMRIMDRQIEILERLDEYTDESEETASI